MRDTENKYKQLQYQSYCNQNDSPCKGVENVNIIVHKKKVKNRNKYERSKCRQQPAVSLRPSRFGTNKNRILLKKPSSMPEINKRKKLVKQRNRSSDAILKKKNRYFNSKFIVNRVSEYHYKEYLSPFNYPTQKKWKVYRCQLSTREDTCCCSCNSDAMFEVMKSLYDCYKKKNCDNCNCILCAHLPRDERRLGEIKKSLESVGLGATKERKAKVKKAEKAIKGKTKEEKEKILKDLAKAGEPLPEGKTESEKAMIRRIRTEVGLPPEPKTMSEKVKMRKAEAAGVMTPLEGKTASQKEKILKAQAQLGVPLPEGRTASEKALIHKIKMEEGIPEGIPPEKLERAKAAGLITPLAGKSPEQKEKILRGLAMEGIPLPEGKTASEKKLIEKVRADLGLPPEPKTSSMREKYADAANAGFMQPLEGKSPKEKERILQGLADRGIPLPEGRTASEKELIAKVKAKARPPSEIEQSERIRKAKALGLLTPLEDKTPEQKEKILRGLAMQGIPLPEAKTASERKLVDKVRADLGLPPEPRTTSMKEKHDQAAKAGLLQPLEGKSTKEKEKILQGLHDLGIPLPEGRTASEKAIIAKVKAGPRAPLVLSPSEKLRKAKGAGLLTPLEGKTPEQKEKILRGLAMQGIPLPEGKTASERKLIDKVRTDLGLPPEPKTASMRNKYATAADVGLLQPLEGKSPKEKERILQGLYDMGIPLPEGRTASEKALIAKVKAGPRPPTVLAPSEKMQKAKAAGLLTPLEGKTPEQKEKILRGLAMQGIVLPEGKTASERKLIDKVRADLGLPPDPKTASMRNKHAKAADAGLLQPLEGKSAKEKEKILQGLHDMGIALPEGRTASEKAIIAKVKAGSRAPSVLAPSEKLRRAKAAGLLTPLTDKTPAQREKILRGLAMQGVPLPEGKTASEKMLINKVRADLGLPPEPKTSSMKEKHAKAADVGLLQPLEGKPPKEKERILQGLHDMGIPLPEGRTASEKALIAKIKAGAPARASSVMSEKIRKAKAAGLLTPLEGKTPAQKEKIIKDLAMQGLPLPEGKTASERKLINKVRADLGLPPEPKTPSMKEKYAKAANAGLMKPLEGKSTKEKEKILQGLHDMGIPLPEGRTSSEKALIAKVKASPRAPSLHVPSEKIRKAQAAGLITPLEGKTAAQKENILRGLAMEGIPLPEAKTASEKKIADKVRADLGLPPAPKTAADKEKYNKAAEAGLIIPLEGKSHDEKERILRGQHDLGLPLPVGRTKSEKALIRQIKAEKPRKTKAVGVGQPALPPDKRRKLDEKTAKVVKEGKGPADECICGLLTPESEREVIKAAKIPSEKLRAAKAAGLLTPLEGKTPEQREKILRGLVKQGLPLPEAKTASEKKIIDKVRGDLGLPPEPKTSSMKAKHARAHEKGLLTPLEGKTASEKEKILRGQAEMGIPLPVGRTASEKALIAKIKASTAPSITTEKLRKAKAAGLLTPLEGKTEEQKEKILRGLAKSGLPLPEGKTASEKALIKKIKSDLGIPQRTPSEKIRRAKTAGLLTPLEGKTKSQKEKILRGRAAAGLPLPVGKTPSERALVQKIKDESGYVTPSPSERLKRAKAAGLLTPLEGKTRSQKEKIIRDRLAAGVPITEGKTPSEKEIIQKITAGEPPAVRRLSEKERRAKAAGLMTPLEGKTKQQKEKILRGLVKAGVPLPEPTSASERDLMDKIRQEVGLPPEPKTPSLKEKYKKAHAAGIITPLEGKTPAEKEKILKKLHDAGIPLPEGRTPSEKSMVKRIKAGISEPKLLSQKLRAAKAAGLLTPLEGKSKTEKEKIIKGLAKAGLPMPEPKTASEKELIKKVRTELGLPPEAATASMKEKMQRAQAAGKITPLEGKTTEQKKKILRSLAAEGIPLPEGRTASEKALISKIKAETTPKKITPEKLAKAKAAGLLTPLAGKSEKEKERILRGLVEQGLPLPEAQTASEKKISEKIRKEFGLPPEPKNSAERIKMRKAQTAGIITPLEGKTTSQKEKILRRLDEAGIPLPEGRTASEKSMIRKIKAKQGRPTSPRAGPPALPPKERAKLDKKTAKVMKEGKGPSDECICGLLTPESEREEKPPKITSERLKKAKAAGLLTPLEGKTTAEKEKILKGLAKEGLPLPEAKTASERKLHDKIRKELGLPPEPTTSSIRHRHEKAAAAGVLVPLEGLPPEEKERILRAQADLGIPLPEGRTASEKALIAKVKAERKAVSGKIPSDKLQKAKAAGLLTPLEGKPTAEKERILRGLAKQGLPLPEAKTASERKLHDKIRKELGLPPEPTNSSIRHRHDKAAAAGVLVPLEGLPPEEKERILRAQADLGIPLPEGRTASEKALIAKVKAESKAPPAKIPSEKLRQAKAAGLLTPLEGKTKKQKEKILRGLAKQGLPMPEAKTSSERKLHDKIRKELGLPPEPATPSMRQKHEQAAAAGVLVPLDGLSKEEKKKILRGQANLGIPLPEGRTASEKALIAQIKAEQEPSKIPSEKLRKAKAAGLLTPLEGKTTAQKEKIIKNLAEAGLPLPEGKTASEKALIQKIRTEMGIPPPARTASEKSVVRKARAEGLLTPLAGKSAKEKERIVKGLIDAGLPVPEGKTASEKELIRKVRVAAGLPPEKTPSERKAEIKTKSKKVGVTPSKRVTKGIAAKAGIDEEYEDIIKTTTCDRGCGCDKKKIRFKHSYVKIRVTSPDISSLCPCPDECIPGVKNGAFIDNEGIKVTVGRVDCVTSYSSQFSNHILESHHKIVTLFDKKLTNSFSSNASLDSVDALPERIVTNDLQKVKCDEYSSEKYISNNGEPNYDLTSSFSYTSGYDSHDSVKTINTESNISFSYESKTLYEKWSDDSDRYLDTSKYFQSLEDIYRNPASISCTSCECTVTEKSSRDSFDSNLVIKSESSLSLSTKLSRSMDVISVISLSNSSSTSDSSHYLYYPASNIRLTNSAVETSECFMNRLNYSKSDYTNDDTVTRCNERIHEACNGMERRDRDNRYLAFSGEKGNDYFTYRLSQTKLRNAHHINRISTRKTNNGEPVIIINNLDSDQDITTMVDQLLSNNEFSNTSSIFVVVPKSDDDSETSSSSVNSTICIQLSENHTHRKQYQTGISEVAATSRRNSSNTQGLKISAKGKMFCMEGMSDAVSSYHKDSMLFKLSHIYKQKENKKSKNKLCQISSPNAVTKVLPPGVSTDTTSDRPCCCAPKKPGDTNHRHGSEHRCVANVVSELITPLLVHQGLNCDKLQVQKRNVNQQASFVSTSRDPISVRPCQVPPCAGQPGCHNPFDMLQIPFGTPMPEPIPEPEPRHSQPCQCNPDKLKQLIEDAVKAGKTFNMTSIGCGGAVTKKPPTHGPPAPIITKPITQLENCASCAKHKYTDGLDMFCACSGKKKSVKLKPLCPCQLHHPPVSQMVTGPRTGTRSLGCQCCLCEDSTLCSSGKKRKPGQIEILGPAGGFVLPEQGGIYTQAGMRPTETSIDSTKKKHCACSGKNGKKNKNIICECPSPEPEPEPEPEYIPQIIPITMSYEQYKSYQMQETKETMKMRSDMTQTQSGFKMFKKKKPPPPPEVEFTVEDAVRYYAIMNPELVRDLVPPPQEFRETTEMPEDCVCEEEDRKKSKRNGVQCECPYETPPPPPPPEPEPEPVIEVEEPPPKGFKFSMGGKGSGSKGLSGVCCFDMFEEVKKKQL